uniref:hypothetical protein n=1 Tax=Rhodococcus sp. T9N TaxID=627445 RepID=UPI0021C47AC9
MSDITASIAKAIQVETGGNVEGKIPEWWAELIGMVLAELQSAGRLVPAGGMALTAERLTELIKHAPAPNDGDYNDGYVAALTDLRDALFPATEHAEDAPCAICNVNETNHAGVSYYHPFTTELGPFDDEGNDRP